jgi:hypothetical protein
MLVSPVARLQTLIIPRRDAVAPIRHVLRPGCGPLLSEVG